MTELTATPATESNVSTPNRSVDAANGVTYAYRRFGDADAPATPLVLLQHFRGNLDGWDPALVDPLAQDREVVLVDNAGVAGSSGTTPPTATGMAHDLLAFLDALGLHRVDLLGFSLGGCVAQEVALIRPHAVRRLVLAGTAPQGGLEIHGFTPPVHALAMATQPSADGLVSLFFGTSETSVARGWDFVQRTSTRQEDRDLDVTPACYTAQLDALTSWGIPDGTRLNRLAGIRQPTLVANGSNDIMMMTPNTHLLGEHLPDARVVIYPDAGHGFLFQYPVEFAGTVRDFLG